MSIRARSTPEQYADGAVVSDSRGGKWRYTARVDMWRRAEAAPGQPALTWADLVHHFGPVTSSRLDRL